MQDEQWDKLTEMLEEKYPELERFREDLEDGNGFQEVLEFEGPLGNMRVVRVSKPVVVGKEFHYSHRPGDTARTEYKFSDSEFTHKLHVYKETFDGEWEEVTLDKLGL